MKSRVKAMVEELASEHQRELAAAGTLVDLEELTRPCVFGVFSGSFSLFFVSA